MWIRAPAARSSGCGFPPGGNGCQRRRIRPRRSPIGAYGNHIADVTIQSKHGVRFIQLQGGDYQTFLGQEGKANEFDIVEMPDGSFDTAFRSFLAVEVLDPSTAPASPAAIRSSVTGLGGREISTEGDPFLAVFAAPAKALECASSILGTPEIAQTIRMVRRLCNIARNREIVLSSLAHRLLGEDGTSRLMDYRARVLATQDEKFIMQLFNFLETRTGEGDPGLQEICANIGTSRAQLYRRMTALTGASPAMFLQELQLKRAMRLLRQNFGNIAQVAFETGFNNPSYFSRTFRRRFGVLPSSLKGRTA